MCKSCYVTARNGPYVRTGSGPGGRGVPKTREVLASRLEEYAELRALCHPDGSHKYSITAAARRVGVNPRTGDRYEARLQRMAGAAATDPNAKEA